MSTFTKALDARLVKPPSTTATMRARLSLATKIEKEAVRLIHYSALVIEGNPGDLIVETLETLAKLTRQLAKLGDQ